MLRTRLCDLLGIEHPIISAPMAGSAGADLAAAVSAAGGLGMLGGNTAGPEWLLEQIELVRQRTDRPFGVGFITSAPDTDALMDVALEHRVPVIGHSFADPSAHIRAAREAGLLTMVQVQSVAQARAAAGAGADVIAAQGIEAGGHTGLVSATLPLVPAVIDAVGDVPVVAAGGIADGRGLAAVLMLGAEGAWMGTRFVASVESISAEFNKQQIVRHGTDDFILTRVYDIVHGAPFPDDIGERILRTPFTDAWHGREGDVIERKAELLAQLQAAAEAGDTSLLRVLAGSGSGLVHDIAPAAGIVRRIVAEAEEILRTRPVALLR
ncbi:MAG TPA: nitronate monooxygenase [Thermomicrobiales bacterium]|nr:nitronate monooxygenase [Thermomicrobiales bacterium]